MKIKTLFAIPSLQTGGMERVMSELLWYFADKENVEIHLVLFGLKRDIFYDIPNDIIVHRPSFKFDNDKRTWYTIKTIIWLRRKIKSINPETVLSFGERWNNMVLLSLLKLTFPVYVSDRCQPDKSLGKFHDGMRKWLYPKANGIIAQTNYAKGVYERLFDHNKIAVIGNPIRKIACDRSVERENIVLSVGRLIDTKHHDELIKLFVSIGDPDWKLIIVGDDALQQNNMNKLQKLIKQLGAEERVELTGQRNDVDTFYLKSRIFAFTSSSEGFPNAVGEAQAAGLPVIAFDCIAGPSDLIINGQNGFLIELFDYESFKNQLNRLMHNSKLRTKIGDRARLDINRYSGASISEKYYNFITDKSN